MFWREPSKGQSSGGRAWYITTKDHIKVLRNTGMQWTTIAQCLGVSPKTLYRKRLEYGFEDSFTDISDEELECNIRDVLRLTPFSGESYVWGALRGCGIFIQRWKIWQVLQAIDPVNCAIRWRSPIRHHLYSVKKPNHLANNLANTVLHCFVNGTQEFGFPFCVRGDRGVENVDVASFIIQNRWLNRGSFICGCSVHNQRIERLWAEVNRVVSVFYRDLFVFMEEDDVPCRKYLL